MFLVVGIMFLSSLYSAAFIPKKSDGLCARHSSAARHSTAQPRCRAGDTSAACFYLIRWTETKQ